jgi:hypothetical protein
MSFCPLSCNPVQSAGSESPKSNQIPTPVRVFPSVEGQRLKTFKSVARYVLPVVYPMIPLSGDLQWAWKVYAARKVYAATLV